MTLLRLIGSGAVILALLCGVERAAAGQSASIELTPPGHADSRRDPTVSIGTVGSKPTALRDSRHEDNSKLSHKAHMSRSSSQAAERRRDGRPAFQGRLSPERTARRVATFDDWRRGRGREELRASRRDESDHLNRDRGFKIHRYLRQLALRDSRREDNAKPPHKATTFATGSNY